MARQTIGNEKKEPWTLVVRPGLKAEFLKIAEECAMSPSHYLDVVLQNHIDSGVRFKVQYVAEPTEDN